MSTLVLYIATSLDGYIATPDGGLDWLPGADGSVPEDGEDYGYNAFYDSVDALIMGSTTYQQTLGFGEWPYADKPSYVLSGRDIAASGAMVSILSDTPEEAMQRMAAEGHERIWLIGGGALARAFMRAGLVDEYMLFVVPVILGEGIAFFGDTGPRQGLRLIESTQYANGMVGLHYHFDAGSVS